MTEEEYTKIQLRYSGASELIKEVNCVEQMISNIERGRQHIDVCVGVSIINHELSDDAFNKIKAIILKHYQNKLREAKQKFEEL